MIVITQNVTTNLSIPLTDYFSKEQLQNIIKDRTGNISANSNIFYAFVQPTLSAEEF